MILVLGIDGLLGQELFLELSKSSKVIGSSRKRSCANIIRYDFEDEISCLMSNYLPVRRVIICAAISNVSECETNPDYSNTINFVRTLEIVEEFSKRSIPSTVFSSEYVFDGSTGNYSERSNLTPCTKYGEQKAMLENEILKLYPSTTILRISKLASIRNDKSFLHKMIGEITKGSEYYAAIDQISSPINIIEPTINM